MSNKEYYLMNLLFVALLFGLFVSTFIIDIGSHLASCQVLEHTGEQCKSCGLTRDFISFTHLDFESPVNEQSIYVILWFLIQLLVRVVLVTRSNLIGPKLKWTDLILSTCSAIFVFFPFWI